MANAANGNKQRVSVDRFGFFKKFNDFFSGQRTLSTLSVEQFFFDFRKGLVGLDECFTDTTITSTIASGDKISKSTTLEEGRQLSTRIELIYKLKEMLSHCSTNRWLTRIISIIPSRMIAAFVLSP